MRKENCYKALLFVILLVFILLAVTCKPITDNDGIANAPVYTVTFDKNYGNSEASPAVMTVTRPALTTSSLPTPSARAGYVFKEWTTYPDGSGADFTKDTIVKGNVTVYAQWEASSPPAPSPNIAPDALASTGKFGNRLAHYRSLLHRIYNIS